MMQTLYTASTPYPSSPPAKPPYFDEVMHRAIAAYGSGHYKQASSLVKQAQEIVEMVIGDPAPSSSPRISIRAQMLGTFRLENSRGESIKLCAHRKGQSLFKYLLQIPNNWYHKEHLIAALFPDETSEAAWNKLHIAVSRLRSALAAEGLGSDALHFEDDGYSLRLDVETDVMLMDAFIQQGRNYEAEGDLLRAIEVYKQAADLYRGDYLSDLVNEEWALVERRHREQRYFLLLERLINLHIETENYPEAIRCCRIMLDHDNLREDIYIWLMIAQCRCGHRSRALKTFEDLRHILRVEFNAEPLPYTVELVAKLRQGTAI